MRRRHVGRWRSRRGVAVVVAAGALGVLAVSGCSTTNGASVDPPPAVLAPSTSPAWPSTPGPAEPGTQTQSPPAESSSPISPDLPGAGLLETRATIERWVDGDTVVTSAGRVRLLGIDTPERGQCGFGPATSLANRLAPAGAVVSLLAAPDDDDTDKYGRLLRYVQAGAVDVGYELISDGSAVARYDSRDGYGAHPREDAYVAADAASPNRCP